MKLQYIKDNIFKVATILAVLALAVMGGRTWAMAEEGSNPMAAEVTRSESIESTLPPEPAAEGSSLVEVNIPNGMCTLSLRYSSAYSTEFNPNTPFASYFMPSRNNAPTEYLQDINGDGLTDYIYKDGGLYGSNNPNGLISRTDGCVYLNNGNGWTKVYECIAESDVSMTTGQIYSQKYKGDCAGAPAGQEN